MPYGSVVEYFSRIARQGRGVRAAPQEQGVGLWQPPGSFHFGAGVNFFEDGGQAANFAVPCSQDHALRFDAHELRWLEVGDNDD